MVPYWFSSLWRRLRPHSDTAVSPALVQDLAQAIRPSLLLDVNCREMQCLRRHLQAPDTRADDCLKKPWRLHSGHPGRYLTGHLEVERDYQSLLVERAGPALLLTGTSQPVDPPGTQLVQFELLSLDRDNNLQRSYSRLKTRVGPDLFSPVLAMTRMSVHAN